VTTKFKLRHEWLASGNDAPEIQHTMANLGIRVGEVELMQNEDSWSQTIRDTVLVSAYPLAMWFASSWWRLLWEPLPWKQNVAPSVAWRMAHEIGAANHGFVWPQIFFASDREAMQIWAMPSKTAGQQSVRYINGLDAPLSLPLAEFQREVASFIDLVVARLAALGIRDVNLAGLWREVQQEMNDPEARLYRRMEAELGYDPDECPDDIMRQAKALGEKMGEAALSELAPVYANGAAAKPLSEIVNLMESRGLRGRFDLPDLQKSKQPGGAAPWERAVADARNIRKQIGIAGRMSSAALCGLLGLKPAEIEQWSPTTRNRAAMAVPVSPTEVNFLPRKKHPMSKRFELARFVADRLFIGRTENPWLASTDLNTARQKYQRAFAAELLCPIAELTDWLDNDYSDSAIEDAAVYFEVSPDAARSLLSNNGVVSPLPYGHAAAAQPYSVGAW
jgi:hypothetical protein